MKKKIQFWYVRISRYLFRKKHLKILAGPLKGLAWTTSMNYEYLTGEYLGRDEEAIIKKILDTPKPVFYDIGANVGYYSITVATLVPACKIHAFEPMPDHLKSFKEHISLNNIKNITLLPMAVADHTGEVVFSNMKGSEGNTYKNESTLFKGAVNTFSVPSTSIDDYAAQSHNYPTLLKIDAEGAELDVLNGAAKTIDQYKPTILLATHDCHVPGIKDKCLAFLKAHGYDTRIIGAYNKHMEGLMDFVATPVN